jgi:hypothetical protein
VVENFFCIKGSRKGLEAVKLVILKIIDFACDFFAQTQYLPSR